jgi:hypothetical protein
MGIALRLKPMLLAGIAETGMTTLRLKADVAGRITAFMAKAAGLGIGASRPDPRGATW